jgi:plastocyanin
MSRTQSYVYLLVAVLIVVTGLALFMQRSLWTPSISRTSASNAPISQPPYTKEVQAQLAASNGFQYLISYTDRGFEPSALDIPEGDTVRFTNNSHRDLWIAASGQTLYPATQQSCAQSAFDSCHDVKSGEFWEFTFTTQGTWSYRNNMMNNDADTGTVTVQ